MHEEVVKAPQILLIIITGGFPVGKYPLSCQFFICMYVIVVLCTTN